jgi:type I restriction enzyme S subunit
MNAEITQTITDIAEVNPSVDLRGLSDDTLVSFIPMSDVTDSGRWTGRQERRLNEVRIGYTPFAEGDILFAKITPCMENGKGAHARDLRNGVGFGSTEFHVLRARGQNNPRFLFHWLQAHAIRLRAIAYMGGSAGQQRVQSDFFTHFRIPQIEPAEQSRIAMVLDTADEAIAKTEAVIAKLKQVRAGLLHDLLTRGLDEHGQFRDPVASPEQFQESALGRIPLDWNVVKFDQLANVIDPQPDHRAPAEVADGEPYIGVGDFLPDGSINFETCRRVSHEAVAKQQARFCIERGDILFGKIGTIGLPRLLPSQRAYALNANTILIKPIEQSSYVYWLLHSHFVNSQIQADVHSTSQPAFGIQRLSGNKAFITERFRSYAGQG